MLVAIDGGVYHARVCVVVVVVEPKGHISLECPGGHEWYEETHKCTVPW